MNEPNGSDMTTIVCRPAWALATVLLVSMVAGPAVGLLAGGGDQEPDEAVVKMVLELLADRDRDMRALGLQQVREAVPGRAATERFAALLPKLPADGQAALLEALGDRRDTAARPAVVPMVNSRSERVRVAALRALGALGSAADVPLLARHAAASAVAERQAARQSLVRLRGKSTDAAILAAFSDGSDAVRAALLGVLAARNARQALPAVVKAAHDPEPAVRLAAIDALRLLADPPHTADLVTVVTAARNHTERRRAELALLALCTRGRHQCVAAIIGGLERSDRAGRLVLLRCLARAGGSAALRAIAERLHDPDEEVRTEAVRMLSIWPEPAAANLLAGIAAGPAAGSSGQTDLTRRHRILATRGLQRLAAAYPADRRLRALAEQAAAQVPEPAKAAASGTGGQSLPLRPPAAAPKAVKLVAIKIELPPPAFRGTPVPLKEPNVEKPRGKPRPPFLAPAGTRNLAAHKPVRCSDPAPTAGDLDYVTDGRKQASDFACLELHPGTQWVQVDLGQRATIYAVLVWHNHAEARVYRDVIVQVSDDPDFLTAHTVFNNDYDNSSGFGIGHDKGYVETAEGRLIDCQGIEGRYVRLYSRGNHLDAKNHYTEVEVYGIPLQ